MEKWQEKFAVVTGASAGIGASIIKDFALNGINVIALARRVEKIDELIADFGETNGKIYPYMCDVSDLANIKECFKWIEEKFGTVNILVNNAGVVFKTRSINDDEETAEKIDKTIATNFNGLVHCSREAVRLMKKNQDPSLIININSSLGHRIPAFDLHMNVYPPTKHAVTAYTEVIRHELIFSGCSNIRVTSVSPGAVKTDAVIAGKFVENRDDFFKGRNFLQPEDITNTILFLLECPPNVNITEMTVKATGEA
jgi:NADP+-dependent farnesol dehydrogenase